MDKVYVDMLFAEKALPNRPQESNKGTFGRILAVIGSQKYPGAMHLAAEAMLRGGAGYTEVLSTAEVRDGLLIKFPEIIFGIISGKFDSKDCKIIKERAENADCILIGPGCGASETLGEVIISLLSSKGAPIVIDADGINSLALLKDRALSALKNPERETILTPHPLEFSRLSSIPIETVNLQREKVVSDFASEYKVTLLLKGKNTLIAYGKELFVNTTGSSALAKAGSGDTLAGLLSSLLATRMIETKKAAAISAFIHGAAGDKLAEKYSEFGVTPSDLPKEMASVILEINRRKCKQ